MQYYPSTKFFSQYKRKDKLSKIKSIDMIIVIRPDKDSRVHVSNKKDYLVKTLKIIYDKSKFKEFGPVNDNSGTIKLEKIICNILKE